MSIQRVARCAPALAAALLGAGAVTAQQPVTLAAFGALQPGRWEVSGPGVPTRAYCVADLAALFQVRHAGATCSRMVIADKPRGATVSYVCPGAGWGRTEIRQKPGGALRIDTQGIADGAPFAFTAAARRLGACAADRAVQR